MNNPVLEEIGRELDRLQPYVIDFDTPPRIPCQDVSPQPLSVITNHNPYTGVQIFRYNEETDTVSIGGRDVLLFRLDRQLEMAVRGEEIYPHLPFRGLLGDCVFQRLCRYPELIPMSWKNGQRIIFWGTVFGCEISHKRWVRCLYWDIETQSVASKLIDLRRYRFLATDLIAFVHYPFFKWLCQRFMSQLAQLKFVREHRVVLS